MNRNRFKDAPFMKIDREEVILVGLGGIGHGVFQKLVDLDQPVIVYEGDKIEAHNCIPQGYNQRDIGEFKITGANNIASQRLGESYGNVDFYTRFYDEHSLVAPIMISAVDSIKTRELIFNKWKQQEDRKLFIDGRMLAEFFMVFAITPQNEDWYEENYLKNKEDVEEEVGQCTYQQTSFCASMIHGVIVQKLINFQLGFPFNKYTEYNGQIDRRIG